MLYCIYPRVNHFNVNFRRQMLDVKNRLDYRLHPNGIFLGYLLFAKNRLYYHRDICIGWLIIRVAWFIQVIMCWLRIVTIFPFPYLVPRIIISEWFNSIKPENGPEVVFNSAYVVCFLSTIRLEQLNYAYLNKLVNIRYRIWWLTMQPTQSKY